MKTEEITNYLADNNFVNWQHWNAKECAEYVRAYFNCSRYIAKKVGRIIKDWES